MKRISVNETIGLCMAGMLFLGSVSSAKAGFVTTEFNSVSISNSMSGGQDSTEQIPEKRLDYYLQLEHDGLFSPASNSGMSTTGSQGSSCAASAAALGVVQTNISGGQLFAYQLSEPGLNRAVPFLDGVFRPPRKVR